MHLNCLASTVILKERLSWLFYPPQSEGFCIHCKAGEASTSPPPPLTTLAFQGFYALRGRWSSDVLYTYANMLFLWSALISVFFIIQSSSCISWKNICKWSSLAPWYTYFKETCQLKLIFKLVGNFFLFFFVTLKGEFHHALLATVLWMRELSFLATDTFSLCCLHCAV